MKVNILTSPTYKAYIVNYPIKAFSKQLKNRDIEVEFFYFETKKLSQCDVLIISSDAFRNKIRQFSKVPDRHELLAKLQKTGVKIIWYDTEDSTGSNLFDVMPFVNLYLKPQILKDKSNYLNKYYGERIFSDYYHRQFGVNNNVSVNRPALDPQYLHKIRIGWGFGLNNYARNVKKKFHILHQFLPRGYQSVQSTSAYSPRTVDISYHVSFHNEVNTVAFQRRKIFELLVKIQKEKTFNMSLSGMLSPRAFTEELKNTAILPSPFGFGEIAARDFEAFIYGIALFKPDMAVVDTWPNYYIANETYIPFAWDFSDFEEKLIEYLEDDKKRIAIASKGQQVYLDSISESGGKKFAERFKELLRIAENTKSSI